MATNPSIPALTGVASAAAAGVTGGADELPPMPDALKAISAVIAGVVPPKRATNEKELPAQEVSPFVDRSTTAFCAVVVRTHSGRAVVYVFFVYRTAVAAINVRRRRQCGRHSVPI
jgi:hypothetical protein